MSTHANVKGSNFKLIIGLLVALGLIGGAAYGFVSGKLKPDHSMELPDGD